MAIFLAIMLVAILFAGWIAWLHLTLNWLDSHEVSGPLHPFLYFVSGMGYFAVIGGIISCAV